MTITEFIVYGNKKGYIVDFNQEEVRRALEFSKDIIYGGNQYNRLLPNDVKDKNESDKYRIQRTCVGKLGEIAFNKLLLSRGIFVDISDMFEIYEGQSSVDKFDFITSDKKTVDIKTGFLSNHKRLIINLEQFNNIKKDYYVGVKLIGNKECNDKRTFDVNSIVRAKIFGYAEYGYLNTKCKRRNFGEGNSVYTDYVSLIEIDKLIKMFR